MPRTIVSLTDEQTAKLRRIAVTRRTSMAAAIRDFIDSAPDVMPIERAERVRRALAVIGKYRSGYPDIADEHDRYLAEDFLG
jgi:hypothetical protein